MPTLVHYSEIGTKGNNRILFENALVRNIRKATGAAATRLQGKILAESDATEPLAYIPGVAYFSPCRVVRPDMEEIKQAALAAASGNGARTFRIESSRSDKKFQYNSLQLNSILGDHVRAGSGMKVDLKKPDITVYAEIDPKRAFLYTEKIPGMGGLPVGTSGKVVCLMSGGIDSPVAAYSMMKRGCEVVFVHFYNYDEKAKTAKKKKIESIVKELNKYQLASRLYMIPFLDLQVEMVKHIPPRCRMIVYRRMMFRIAEHVLEKENAKAFVTGDNVAQVASQTLENLNVIYEAAKYPVLAPLIGMNKQEIIDLAERIGTYKTSILPYEDCCTFLVAKHPETRASIEKIAEIESRLEAEEMIKDTLKLSDVIDI